MDIEVVTMGAAAREMESWADERVVHMYRDLRAIAHARLRAERVGHTLDTSALAHEAYLRLVGSDAISSPDRETFLAAASLTMRRLLVEHARRRSRQKRGGGLTHATLDEATLVTDTQADELVELDEALDRLAAYNARASAVIQHRVFSGFTLEETAHALGLSAKTVQRDWNIAIAWLRKELRHDLPRVEM